MDNKISVFEEYGAFNIQTEAWADSILAFTIHKWSSVGAQADGSLLGACYAKHFTTWALAHWEGLPDPIVSDKRRYRVNIFFFCLFFHENIC